MTIAATRRAAVGEAGVGLEVVAVVAGLDAALDDAVTATGEQAVGQAGVAVVGVAIITGFIAWRVLSEVLSSDPIAAASELTIDAAPVIVLRVAVIAGLDAITDVSVTAACHGAVHEAVVGLEVVAVIALLLPEVQNTVAASSGLR